MVKTGTTNDKRDNWTIGGNDNAMVGVWVGNNDNTPMTNVASGVSGASPIWRRIVTEALRGKPNVTFSAPGDLTQMQVDSVSGYAAHDGFSSRNEYFIKGTEPGTDPVHVMLKLCKEDGNLATPGQIDAGDYNSREYFVLKEEDPTAAPGGPNKWQEAILNWENTQTDSRYHPPTNYCGSGNPVNVVFVNPTDKSSNVPNSFTIKFTADSVNDIVQADLYIDGSKVKSFSSIPYTYDANLSNGVHTLRAVATDSQNKQSDRTITIGINIDWNASTPSPTP